MTDARTSLLNVLHEAASQDYLRMKKAEELLKQWENERQFFTTLQDIFYDLSVDYHVRFLSGIYLKNGIQRFWRKTATNPMTKEEKSAIRQRLIQFLGEPSDSLVAQNAIITARIARLDFPNEWPELIPTLIQAIETTSSGNTEEAERVNSRAIETLYEVLVELSTRLLSSGRKQFTAIAPRTFQTIAQVYMIYTEKALTQLLNTNALFTNSETMTRTERDLKNVSTCVKCLRLLMVNGIKDVHKYDETRTFIEISRQHIQHYVELYNTITGLKPPGSIIEKLETLIEDYGTMYLGLQKSHPISSALCSTWVSLLDYYWQTIVTRGSYLGLEFQSEHVQALRFPQQLILQGMVLVRNTIKIMAKNADKHVSDNLTVTEEELALSNKATQIMKEQFLTPTFVNTCAETLVAKYMLFTRADIEQWEEDPEGWLNHTDNEDWEFEIRPCAEITFMTLLTEYRSLLSPILLRLVDQVASVTDQSTLLLKDAVYCSVGLGVQSLYGKLDFEGLVANRLLLEVANKEAGFKILRRRIAWLLGKWVREGISDECRTTVYQILLQLMVPEEDLVVRLTAAHSLKMAIDDWDFDIGVLQPYLSSAIEMIMALLNQVEESDTVMKLISDMNAIMDRSQEEIIPYAPKIMDAMTPMWNRAQHEPLFQSSLVVTFTKLVGILNIRSAQLQELFVPMVEYCVNKNNEAHVYLIDDALDLWWTLLQTTPFCSPQLMALLPVAIGLLDFDTENMRKVLKIIESYILVSPEASLQYASLLFGRLASYVDSSKSEVASSIVSVIDLAFVSVPIQVYGDALIQSGLLEKILHTFLKDELYAYALMAYMSLFARLAIYDPHLVIQWMQSQIHPLTEGSSLFEKILDAWIDKFDHLSHPRSRKLTCMALTSMVRTNHSTLLSRLPSIFAIWTDVLAEVIEADSNEVLLHSESHLEEDIAQLDASLEKSRKLELAYRDPVYTTDLVSFIQQTLTECEERQGGAESFQEVYLSKVDPSLLEQVHQLFSAR
ncbi:armadillo-type protein [Spinellus fusiger]|nr:armadillo-type protein [Spinellus fusiger]